jgi:hypothetical protein
MAVKLAAGGVSADAASVSVIDVEVVPKIPRLSVTVRETL